MSSNASVPQSIPVRSDMVITDLSQSVGGTLYGVTPGGTRVVYDRHTLLHLRNSPYSKTPPVLPDFGSLKTKPALPHGAKTLDSAKASSASATSAASAAHITTSAAPQGHAQAPSDDAEMFDMD